jgi:branched-chain amino acid transport system permease protein
MRRVTLTRGSVQHRLIVRSAIATGLVLATLYPFYASQTDNFKFTLVIIWAMAAIGLTLLTGLSGQISLAQSVFFAAGAYTSAILITDHGWHYLLTVPVGVIVAFVLGVLIGLPARRLSGLYLATVTLAAAVVMPPLLRRLSFTGGDNGIVVTTPSPPSWAGSIAQDQWIYLVALVVGLAVLTVAWSLTRSGYGRALIAMRDNEIAAQAFGVDAARLKVLTFAISAAMAGAAGSVYSFTVGFVGPASFDLFIAVGFLSAMVVGGVGSLAGAVLGAAFVRLMPDYTAEVSAALPGFVYGITLILVMLVLPRGIVGLLTRGRDLVVDLRDPVVVPNGPSSLAPEPSEPKESTAALS